MNEVITIGRQFGSGGHEVGCRLAKVLNIPFYDDELLTITAENSQLSESFIAKIDEQKPGILSRGNTEIGGNFALGSYYQLSANDRVFVEMCKTMRSLAEKGQCVIVGRCADYVLRNMPTIDFFICADIEDRIARKITLEKEQNVSEQDMKKRILDTDKARAKYYEYYTHTKWGDYSHYHLCLNTSNVGIDGAVRTLEKYVTEFGKNSILPD